MLMSLCLKPTTEENEFNKLVEKKLLFISFLLFGAGQNLNKKELYVETFCFWVLIWLSDEGTIKRKILNIMIEFILIPLLDGIWTCKIHST